MRERSVCRSGKAAVASGAAHGSVREEPEADPLARAVEHRRNGDELIRPSLCVQAREGRLHVFLPYASKLADYLDVLAAVEDTCQHLNMPVWLEGIRRLLIRGCVVQRDARSRRAGGKSSACEQLG